MLALPTAARCAPAGGLLACPGNQPCSYLTPVGWHLGLTLEPVHEGEQPRRLTAAAYYAYRIFLRASDSDHLFRAMRLFQEYVCDAYSQVEDARLDFFKYNQDKLRADTYTGLQASLAFLRQPLSPLT